MAIHEEQQRKMGAGMMKTIDPGAMDLMLDTLQKYQYTYPIKSTVREILSNAIDSISEKTAALRILKGEVKVEELFEEREGEIYKDSKFDINYYDPKYLSNNNRAEITYQEGSKLEKDKVIVRDHGVGMSIKRLNGYFKLGFSTKRLSKLPLGKFGIGAKSPLSVGVDFYTVESVYNGELFRFNVYSHSVDSLIPVMNINTGHVNKKYVLNEGTEYEYVCYSEPTTRKNGVSVTITVKKHHKQQYIDAVKSQMLYFDNIDLTLIKENGTKESIDFQAPVLYEDDYIILSDNNYYSKPHLLLNKVNYGYIDWSELELEDKIGNIGIKVQPEEVEVNPSRESIIWSEKTKQMVQFRFKNVVDIATKFIQEELQEKDFIRWIRKCYNVSGRYSEKGGNTILSRLANIVDLSQVKPSFMRDKRIRFYQADMLSEFYVRYVHYEEEYKAGTKKRKVKRLDGQKHRQNFELPIFLLNEGDKAFNRKDKYLLSLFPQGFFLCHAPLDTEEKMILAGMEDELIEKMKASRAKETAEEKTRRASPQEIWEYVKESAETRFYEEVEVPEDFKANEDEEEVEEAKTEEEEVQQKVAKQTSDERRKLEGKILMYTPRPTEGGTVTSNKDDGNGGLVLEERVYEMAKLEVPIRDINDFEAEEIYYGQDGEDDIMHLAAMLTRDPYFGNEPAKPHRWVHSDPRVNNYDNNLKHYIYELDVWQEKKWYRLNKDRILNYKTYGPEAYRLQHFFDNREIMLIKTSRSNQKYIRDFKPIQQFFVQIKDKTITMSNVLIRWNTARLIHDKLVSIAFLYNFGQFNPLFRDKYHSLIKYVQTNYREVAEFKDKGFYGLTDNSYEDLVQHLDNVKRFQDFVSQKQGDPVAIAALANELFGNRELKDGMAVDPVMMKTMQDCLEFGNACGEMLNYMNILTGYQTGIPPATYSKGIYRQVYQIPEHIETEIKMYLESKGLLDWGKEEDLQEVVAIEQLSLMAEAV